MSAFVTGSYAYGAPKEESDIDLVVQMTEEDINLLCKSIGVNDPIKEKDSKYPDRGLRCTLRFGKLNLICCSTKKQINVWKKGTTRLKEIKPVTRKQAVKLFTKLRKEAGLE